ncbi:MAG: AI-2E family transporter [Oscillospiraceae bacterium]|nr:AI-2E family transporter [Oscillospiraceae bacterium]
MKTNLERSKWFPLFILAVILLFIYNMLGNFTSVTGEVSRFLNVVSPLFYGVLISYFLYIPHQLFEKLISKIKIKFIKKRARLFATLLVLVLVAFIVTLVVSYIIPILFTSIIDLANSIPGYVVFINNLMDNIPEDQFWSSLNIVETLADNAGAMISQAFNAATIEQFAMGIISFASELLNLVLGLAISLYMLLERDRILGFFRGLSKALFKTEKRRDRVNRYIQQINKVLFTFIASKGLDSIINFVVVTTILLIFDVPYALLLGILAGVFNFIPYLGSLIAVITITLITIITGGFYQAVQVLIPLFIFQQIDGNFIEPRIMKSSLKISPILVIIAVVIGGAYFGVVGMFLAVPIAVIIKQILKEYMSYAENPEEAEAPDETTRL